MSRPSLASIAPWIGWALAFGFFEWRGLQHPNDGVPTLTETVHKWVPGWLVFAGIGWLAFHFAQTYIG